MHRFIRFDTGGLACFLHIGTLVAPERYCVKLASLGLSSGMSLVSTVLSLLLLAFCLATLRA